MSLLQMYKLIGLCRQTSCCAQAGQAFPRRGSQLRVLCLGTAGGTVGRQAGEAGSTPSGAIISSGLCKRDFTVCWSNSFMPSAWKMVPGPCVESQCVNETCGFCEAKSKLRARHSRLLAALTCQHSVLLLVAPWSCIPALSSP